MKGRIDAASDGVKVFRTRAVGVGELADESVVVLGSPLRRPMLRRQWIPFLSIRCPSYFVSLS